MSALYTFMYTRLMEASRQRSPAFVEEVIRLLTYERETWSMTLQKLAEEQGSASPEGGPEPQEPSGGTVSVKG